MMSKTLVSRRTALKALGTTAGAVTFLPWLSEDGLAAFAAVQKAKAAPALKALTAAQYATTEALAEAIIPADERSPGAREARVADYIDLLLSETKPPLRKEWIDGLTAFDAEATKRFGAPFVKLTPAQVETYLTDVSAYERPKEGPPDQASAISRNEQPKEKPILVEGLMGDVSRFDPSRQRPPLEAFFAVTKRATIHGYYTSEIGIHKELRYKGNQVLAEFVGCQTQDGKDCPHCGQKAGN
jgi:hypothetical protein